MSRTEDHPLRTGRQRGKFASGLPDETVAGRAKCGFDLPLSGVWDWVRVLGDVMMDRLHDSGGPRFFPPDITTVISPVVVLLVRV
jgi:hypothetical protein